MKLRERIGKLPAWKAAIILFLITSFVLAAIEEVFVSRVLLAMDKAISYFEKEKISEINEWDKDEKAFAKLDKKWKQGFAELEKKNEEMDRQDIQRKYCLDYLEIQKAKTYLRKHKETSKNLVIQAWERDEKDRLKESGKSQTLIDLENAIKTKQFNPATCNKEAV